LPIAGYFRVAATDATVSKHGTACHPERRTRWVYCRGVPRHSGLYQPRSHATRGTPQCARSYRAMSGKPRGGRMGTRVSLRPRTRQDCRREQNGQTRETSTERPPGRPGKDVAVSQSVTPESSDPTTGYFRQRMHRRSAEDWVSANASERKPRALGVPESKARNSAPSSGT
jgi:hypothetical protein